MCTMTPDIMHEFFLIVRHECRLLEYGLGSLLAESSPSMVALPAPRRLVMLSSLFCTEPLGEDLSAWESDSGFCLSQCVIGSVWVWWIWVWANFVHITLVSCTWKIANELVIEIPLPFLVGTNALRVLLVMRNVLPFWSCRAVI